MQVGQARADSGDVAETVAVGVGERARVDLVDHRVAPPVAHLPGRDPGIALADGEVDGHVFSWVMVRPVVGGAGESEGVALTIAMAAPTR